jgi:drug/metabolite transporter (DMT)-like permease
MRAFLAVVVAAATSSLYALSTSLQALEARQAPEDEALRASLLARLVRRRLWLIGAAAGLVAWPLQATALTLGSVALVQPALGLGLVVLLVLGWRVLDERPGVRELAGAGAIAAAVALLAWSAPAETGSFGAEGELAIALSLALIAPAPLLLRAAHSLGGLAPSIAAGLGWGWVGLGTSFVDAALADRHLLAALAWALGVGAASWGTLISEMTSLQRWPATRAVPVAFGLEMAAPAAVAAGLTDAPLPHPTVFAVGVVVACSGAVLLGTSGAVARAVTAERRSEGEPARAGSPGVR